MSTSCYLAYKYLKSAQVIPDKGMSFTLYEIEEENKIVRILTMLPGQEKAIRHPDPAVKILFAPERCEEITEEEFMKIWGK